MSITIVEKIYNDHLSDHGNEVGTKDKPLSHSVKNFIPDRRSHQNSFVSEKSDPVDAIVHKESLLLLFCIDKKQNYVKSTNHILIMFINLLFFLVFGIYFLFAIARISDMSNPEFELTSLIGGGLGMTLHGLTFFLNIIAGKLKTQRIVLWMVVFSSFSGACGLIYGSVTQIESSILNSTIVSILVCIPAFGIIFSDNIIFMIICFICYFLTYVTKPILDFIILPSQVLIPQDKYVVTVLEQYMKILLPNIFIIVILMWFKLKNIRLELDASLFARAIRSLDFSQKRVIKIISTKNIKLDALTMSLKNIANAIIDYKPYLPSYFARSEENGELELESCGSELSTNSDDALRDRTISSDKSSGSSGERILNKPKRKKEDLDLRKVVEEHSLLMVNLKNVESFYDSKKDVKRVYEKYFKIVYEEAVRNKGMIISKNSNIVVIAWGIKKMINHSYVCANTAFKMMGLLKKSIPSGDFRMSMVRSKKDDDVYVGTIGCKNALQYTLIGKIRETLRKYNELNEYFRCKIICDSHFNAQINYKFITVQIGLVKNNKIDPLFLDSLLLRKMFTIKKKITASSRTRKNVHEWFNEIEEKLTETPYGRAWLCVEKLEFEKANEFLELHKKEIIQNKEMGKEEVFCRRMECEKNLDRIIKYGLKTGLLSGANLFAEGLGFVQ